MSAKTTFALFGALLLVVGAAAPAAAAAGATPAQPADTTATDVFPDNNTTDNTTDLPDNETNDADENETDIDGDNETELDGNETDEDQSSADAHNEFARMLTDYVQNVTNDSNVSAPGLHIAEWIIEHNPGNAPEHAGPPADAGPSAAGNTTDNESTGPPEHAGNGDDAGNTTDDGGQGPPDHAGNDDGDDDEEEDDGNGAGNGSSASIIAFLPFF